MAHKRMFSKDIVGSDAFTDMPATTQLLYFHLGMHADDDGFIGSPKMIMRSVGANDDDLKILLSKRFLLSFPSGVVVVKHWRINNTVRNDRYNETRYVDEKKLLRLKENMAYTEDILAGIPNGNQMATVGKPSIGEDRIGEDSNTVAKATPFIFSDYLEEMKKDKQKHVRMIALFFSKKNIEFTSKEQIQIALKRHLKPARSLVEFENQKVLKAMDECIEMEKQKGISWTLETVVKLLTK